MLWVGHHAFLECIHPKDTKNFYFLVQWEAKKTYALMKWTHLLNYQLPNTAMVTLKLNIFLIPWNILLLNLFSVFLLCWLRTGRWYIKFLVDTKMQRASLLYFLGFESFVLYYEISLTHFKPKFHFYTHKNIRKPGVFYVFRWYRSGRLALSE